MYYLNRIFWVGLTALVAFILLMQIAQQTNVYALVDNDNGPAYWHLIWGKHGPK